MKGGSSLRVRSEQATAARLESGELNLSIIIPTYNRANSLAGTLDSLAQSIDAAPEIVVVDNNSTDDTKRVVESFALRSGRNVRYVLEKKPGVSFARNRAIKDAKGDLLIFTDDDMGITPSWLSELRSAFDRYEATCVGGRVLVDHRTKLPAWWDKRLIAPISVFDLGDDVIISNSETKDALAIGCNFAILRSALERNGGFRTDFGRIGSRGGGGDSEIVLRLQRNGEKVVYYPPALLYHLPDMRRFTRKSLPRFYYMYGITCCRLDLLFPQAGPRLVGLPRWKYRWLMGDSLRACQNLLTRDSRKAFYHRMTLYRNWGYANAIVKLKRGALAGAAPEPVQRRSS